MEPEVTKVLIGKICARGIESCTNPEGVLQQSMWQNVASCILTTKLDAVSHTLSTCSKQELLKNLQAADSLSPPPLFL